MADRKDKMLRRLKKDLFIRKSAREEAPEKNLHQFENKRAQRLSDVWFSQRETATIEQKNQVGLAYISKVLGLGDDVAQRFAQGNESAYCLVGKRQGGAEAYTPNFEVFWMRVRKLFPGIYSDEDISLLTEQGGVEAAWHFQWQLEIPLAEKSPVLRDLAINAHIYK